MFTAIKTFFAGGSGLMTYIVVGLGAIIGIMGFLLWLAWGEIEEAHKANGILTQQNKELAGLVEHNAEMLRRVGQQHAADMIAITRELEVTKKRKNRTIVVAKETIRERPEDILPENCPN